MKTHQIRQWLFALLSITTTTTLLAQSNSHPSNGNVTIGDGHLIQTGTSNNLQTQGAIKLSNYLLFDSDGDITGGNYFTMQDHASGDYLRMGYGFSDHLVINSIGNVGIGTNNPNSKLEVKTTAGTLKVDGLGSSSAKISSSAALGLETAGSGFIQFLSGGTEIGRFTNDGKLAIGTNSVNISGTSVNTLVIGDASSSEGLIVNANANNDGILSFASDGVLVSRFIYNNPSNKLHFYRPSQGNMFTIDAVGNIGVGTASPNSRLHILQFDQNGLRFERNGHDGYDIRLAGSRGLRFFNLTSSEYELVLDDGKLGIGTTTPDEKLTVKGKIHSEEVRVDLSVPAPDYVFEPHYNLQTLESLEKFIKSEKHLPEIPSAKEMEANGVELGLMNMLLLKKIEELTLYLIDLKKEHNDEITELKTRIRNVESK